MTPYPLGGVDSMLRPSRTRLIAQELFTNTAHYPIVLVMLELIPEGFGFFVRDPALYVLVAATLAQAFLLGSWQHRGRPMPVLGNLIAPGLYTVVEVLAEGSEFFSEPRHLAYWAYAIVVGCLQHLRLHATGRTEQGLHLLETTVRTSILLVGFWLIEATSRAGEGITFRDALGDPSHQFMALAVLFIGLSLGSASVSAQSYLSALVTTSHRLQQYSEWLLGRHLLDQAIEDPSALAPRRRHRAVLFMDIRNFTNWSEGQPPERVATMLSDYFHTGESIWVRHRAIKAKPSADEIMMVFPDALSAVRAALDLRRDIDAMLGGYGLGAGFGAHSGQLIEGVLGSDNVKAYDVIGDVVNTAKRICDHARRHEILISEDLDRELDGQVATLAPRRITAKGKTRPLTVYPVADPRSVER